MNQPDTNIQPQTYDEPVVTTSNDDWDEELSLEESQVAVSVANACRIGDPDCESCQ
ncbi:MAG: hypothetical protein AAF708_12745 [Deinococcota bacterium]